MTTTSDHGSGTKSYDVLLNEFKVNKYLGRKNWTIVDCGWVPLDSIRTDLEIAKYLMTADEQPEEEELFGIRHPGLTIKQLFDRPGMEEAVNEEQEDSQEAFDMA